MQKIIVGIPRALLYYKYHILWETFFKELGITTITSNSSTKEALEIGRRFLIDEACLSMKLYMGHVKQLLPLCDYVLVPRIICLKKKEKLCTNFSALYDLVHNLFPDTKLLHYNIDVPNQETEFFGLLHIGLQLGFPYIKIVKAYHLAKQKELAETSISIKKQTVSLKSNNIKILLAGHPYNLHDKLIGANISNYLERENIKIIYSDKYDLKDMNKDCNHLSKNIYWTYNREIMASLWHYQSAVDGIILITTFPCGPDSLANEMCLRKLKNIPILNIIVDELSSETGLITRLESFIDIIKQKKELYEKQGNN